MWYIPFVTLLFALAPVFLAYRKAPATVRGALLLAAFVLGLLVYRPIDNIDKAQALAYFGFFYLAGIEASLRAPQLMSFVTGLTRFAWISLALIAACVIEAQTIGYWGSYGDWFEGKHAFNFRYLTNSILIVFLASTCVNFPALNREVMRRFADDSFGIFFLHNLVLLLALNQFGQVTITGLYLIDILICSAMIFTGSWLLVLAIKTVAKKHSRWLIGA